MPGYRDPDPEEPEKFTLRTTFEDQFQWDGSGYLFWRFGLGRPVRVTSDEHDQAVDRFETIGQQITMGAVAAGISLVLLGAWLIPPSDAKDYLFAAGALAGAGLNWLFKHLLWRRLIRPFARRTPAGPVRTLDDRFRPHADQRSWANLAMHAAVSGAAIAFLIYTFKASHLFDAIGIAVASVTVVVLAWTKLRRPRRR